MADRADVTVTNVFPETGNSINVARKVEETIDFETTIPVNGEEMINLPGPEASLIIHAPDGVDIKERKIHVHSDVDLAVTCSRTASTWTLAIIQNDLPPDVPTTINVSVGDLEPG